MRTPHFITGWLVISSFAMVSGCSRPVLTEANDPSMTMEEEPGVGFRMVNAGFWTNGTLRSTRIQLESEEFSILFVYLPESGLYLVTLDESAESQQAGSFVGSELVFSAGRTEIRFLSDGGHLFTDQVDREAWVEYLPGLIVLSGGMPVQDTVVGLARLRSHVPGL